MGGGDLIYDQVLNTKQCLLELPGADAHVWIPTAVSVRLQARVYVKHPGRGARRLTSHKRENGASNSCFLQKPRT